jgi:hypothetical protein
MTRGASAAAKAYAGPIFWLADIVPLGAGSFAESITDGGFDNSAAWACSGTAVVEDGVLKFNNASDNYAVQQNVLLPNRTYTMTIQVLTPGATYIGYYHTSSPGYTYVISESTAGTFTATFTTPADVDGRIFIGGIGTFNVDNVSVIRAGPSYFWNGAGTVSINGKTYLPYLRINSGFRRTRSIQVDSGEIELDNTDLYIQTLLDSVDFDGAACTVYQYLFNIQESILIMTGRLGEQVKTLETLYWRLVNEFDPSQTDVLGMQFAALCSWRFAKPMCGYANESIAVTENLAEQTADIYTASTIGKAALTMTTNEHADRIALITIGTGQGQARRIRSNTATTLSLYQPWTTTPGATSKFRVVSATYGVPKQLFTATTAVTIATADVFTSRTIGYSGLAMTTNEHISTGEDAVAGLVRIVAGTGIGQERKIKGNTATTITIADDDAAFSPVPDATSQFRVLYLRCPKDVGSACEQRGRTHRFSGAPTVTPELTNIYEK